MKDLKIFMIGAATSAHQVEGTINSDYWIIENLPGSNFKEPLLDAVDHITDIEKILSYQTRIKCISFLNRMG